MTHPNKITNFKKWVLWTGIFNILAFSGLTCPFTLKQFLYFTNKLGSLLNLGGSELAFPTNINNVVLINVLGIVVVLLGIMLVVASFDIKERAWFVFWEGLIRIFVFLLILYFVLFMNAAQVLLFFGGIDLIIGILYLYYIFTIKEIKIK